MRILTGPFAARRLPDQRRMTRRASPATAFAVLAARSAGPWAAATRRFCPARTRRITSAVPAVAVTTTAITGRTQLRGSRMARSSQLSSSTTAASVRSTSVDSNRLDKPSGGSTGCSARLSNVSMSAPGVLITHDPFELPDGTVQEELRGPVCLPERPWALAVVHSQRKAHDESFAAIVRQFLHSCKDPCELVAALHEVLRRVDGRQTRCVVDRRLWSPRPVAIEVRGQVVRDPDQPRP